MQTVFTSFKDPTYLFNLELCKHRSLAPRLSPRAHFIFILTEIKMCLQLQSSKFVKKIHLKNHISVLTVHMLWLYLFIPCNTLIDIKNSSCSTHLDMQITPAFSFCKSTPLPVKFSVYWQVSIAASVYVFVCTPMQTFAT